VLLVILSVRYLFGRRAMSFANSNSNLRPIALLAFGLRAVHHLPWRGSALSLEVRLGVRFPARSDHFPDRRRSAASIAKLGLPRPIVVVLEGEGLANDATALVLYRFASWR